MSKHLRSRDIDDIVMTIQRMRGGVTWDKIAAKLKKELGVTHSKFTLMRYDEIKAAYNARKSDLKEVKKTKVEATRAAKSQLPKDPAKYIADLEMRLQQQTELLATVLQNAAALGVPLERLERPPNPVNYSPTYRVDK